MTFDDILTLAKAGFTAQQISGIYNSIGKAETPAAAAPTEAPKTEPAPAPAPAKEEPKPEPQKQEAETEQPKENDTQAMLREMLGLMRQGNINNIGMSAQTAEDPAAIMASILAPNGNKLPKE